MLGLNQSSIKNNHDSEEGGAAFGNLSGTCRDERQYRSIGYTYKCYVEREKKVKRDAPGKFFVACVQIYGKKKKKKIRSSYVYVCIINLGNQYPVL